ncbi:MAG: rhodanese-like domain-containing protein [Pseudomonadota bacterium]
MSKMFKNLLVVTGATLVLTGISSVSLACGEDGQMAMTVRQVSVAELAGLMDSTAGLQDKLAVVDVNSSKTRSSMGVIPGAILLSSSSQYVVAKELPASKSTPLVFYCANTHCTASKTAAQRALDAGYVNVAILPEGIAGWRQARKPTETPSI